MKRGVLFFLVFLLSASLVSAGLLSSLFGSFTGWATANGGGTSCGDGVCSNSEANTNDQSSSYCPADCTYT
ncbi:hypothetical protein HY501_03270, partial [Candidatus Woesearchaeota archaeon]|nr:hypothetical protein [Candidatus Woesearchaeota archaeon]